MAWPTVLVVDDDETCVSLLRAALEVRDYRVVAATDGEAAVALARRVHPRVILLDLVMPDMDGAETSRRLRADPATAGIPIVAVSAAVQVLTRPDLPVDARLEKPFALDDLYAIVGPWLAP